MNKFEEQLLYAPVDPDPQIDGRLVVTENATTNYYFMGMDYIQEWYVNNYAGEELKAESTFVNLLVKFSMVSWKCAKKHTNTKHFLDIFQIEYSDNLDLEDKLGDIFQEGSERLELILDCYTLSTPKLNDDIDNFINDRSEIIHQCRDKFVPMITNKGLCSTINSAPLRKTFPNLQSVKEHSLVFQLI